MLTIGTPRIARQLPPVNYHEVVDMKPLSEFGLSRHSESLLGMVMACYVRLGDILIFPESVFFCFHSSAQQ